MVQLVSSHVPTKEDVIYYTKEYPKVVRREITDMTGNDPGDVALYPFLFLLGTWKKQEFYVRMMT